MRGEEYSFIQVDGGERQSASGSFENLDEANRVADVVQQVCSGSRGVPGKWDSADRIRVITFYQAQVRLIKRVLSARRLGDVVVATVDSSQGCEADIVVISFVRSHGPSGRQTVGFLADDRRMNVALTRAKYQLVCIGNFARMLDLQDEKAATVRLLAEDAHRRGCVVHDPQQQQQQPREPATSANPPPLELDGTSAKKKTAKKKKKKKKKRRDKRDGKAKQDLLETDPEPKRRKTGGETDGATSANAIDLT